MDDAWRSHFPITETTTYLANHELGAMSFESSDLLARFAEAWAVRGTAAWIEEWSRLPVEVGNLLAPIIGASSNSTIITTGMNSALTAIASCFRFRQPQTRFVTTQLEKGPLRRYWSRQAGLDESVVRSWDGRSVPTETFLAAIDERTAIVSISHSLTSGVSGDLKRIVAAAHDVDGYVVLDCTSSAGTMPIDVESLGVDFAVGRADTWLCGGTPATWLYVHPEIQANLEPLTPGWNADAHPAWTTQESDGIWRFLDGPPNPPALYALRAALNLIGSVGLQQIRRSSLLASDHAIGLATEAGFTVTSDASTNRGAVTTVEVGDAYETQDALQQEAITVGTISPTEVAIGAHFFNNRADVDACFDALRRTAT